MRGRVNDKGKAALLRKIWIQSTNDGICAQIPQELSDRISLISEAIGPYLEEFSLNFSVEFVQNDHDHEKKYGYWKIFSGDPEFDTELANRFNKFYRRNGFINPRWPQGLGPPTEPMDIYFIIDGPQWSRRPAPSYRPDINTQVVRICDPDTASNHSFLDRTDFGPLQPTSTWIIPAQLGRMAQPIDDIAPVSGYWTAGDIMEFILEVSSGKFYTAFFPWISRVSDRKYCYVWGKKLNDRRPIDVAQSAYNEMLAIFPATHRAREVVIASPKELSDGRNLRIHSGYKEIEAYTIKSESEISDGMLWIAALGCDLY